VLAFHPGDPIPPPATACFRQSKKRQESAVDLVTAVRHVWIRALPKGDVPACGMGLNYMLETLPFTDVIGTVFAGSGECAEASWLFLASPFRRGRWCSSWR
jgi:disulfide bond formation protein DsbB